MPANATAQPLRFLAVPDGEDLAEALRAATAGLDGWVQAVGFVEDAELRLAGEGADPVRAARGRHTLVSLAGPAGGPYGVVLARANAGGASVIAGQLVRGRALGVTATLVALDHRAVAEPEPEPPAPDPVREAAPAASSWAALAQVSAAQTAELEPDDDADEDHMPEPGDRVQHFAFGLCDVLMVSGDRLKIRDLRGPGRIREISVDKLIVEAPELRDGKRVFTLSRRR
jgi:hypothetical protein